MTARDTRQAGGGAKFTKATAEAAIRRFARRMSGDPMVRASDDMLEALRLMVGADGHADIEVRKAARVAAFTAIAKAEGRS